MCIRDSLDTAHLFDYDSISPAHGTQFPANPAEGDFFVRTDFTPNRLYKRVGTLWTYTADHNPNDDSWEARTFSQRRFTNNPDTISMPGEDVKSKQGLSSVIKPKSDV